MAESTLNESLTEGAEQSLEHFLTQHSEYTSNSSRLSENDVRHISSLLQYMGKPSWAKVPRLYVVLRLVKHVHVIESFLAQGVSDIWFPFSLKTLPESLRSASARFEFIQLQDLVLTKAFDLEREDGKHRHFSRADDIPLQKLGELGKGGFGYVDRVLSTVTYKEYARKLIPKGKTFKKNRNVLLDFERKLGNLKKLSHIHIVEFIGSYTDPKFVGILMSPVADYNLKDFLTRPTLSPGDLSFLRTFFGCLASAVSYLHEQQIRHKDIKPQNVLVKREQVFLTDFGISLDWSELDNSMTSGVTVKTLRYCAPEVASYRPRDSSSDMWSLGCVFLEMWTVLRGESVAALNGYFITHGTKSNCYFQNSQAAEEWCELLMDEEENFEQNLPVLWVCELLQYGSEQRWTAQTLVQRIQEANENPNLRFSFAGTCCVGSDDSTASISSSRRSSVMLEETGASSIEVYDPHLSIEKPPSKTSIDNLSASSGKQTFPDFVIQSHSSLTKENLDNDVARVQQLNSVSTSSGEQAIEHTTVGHVGNRPSGLLSLIRRKPLARQASADVSQMNRLVEEHIESQSNLEAEPRQEQVIHELGETTTRVSSSRRETISLELEGSLPSVVAAKKDLDEIRKMNKQYTPKGFSLHVEVIDSNFSSHDSNKENKYRGTDTSSKITTIVEPASADIDGSFEASTKQTELDEKTRSESSFSHFRPEGQTEIYRSQSSLSIQSPQVTSPTLKSPLLSAGTTPIRSRSMKSAHPVQDTDKSTPAGVTRVHHTIGPTHFKSDSKLVENLGLSDSKATTVLVANDGPDATDNLEDLKLFNSLGGTLDLSLRSPSQTSFQRPNNSPTTEAEVPIVLIRSHNDATLTKLVKAPSTEPHEVKYRYIQGWRDKLKMELERCPTCARKLTSPYIQGSDGFYHEGCLECTLCGVAFDAQRPFFTDRDLDGGKTSLYCFTCYRLRRGCAKCSSLIEGNQIMASDYVCHPECLKCCSESCTLLEDDKWYAYDRRAFDNTVYCFYHYCTVSSKLCPGCLRIPLKEYHSDGEDFWHLECYRISDILTKLDNLKTARAQRLLVGPVLVRSHLEQLTCDIDWSGDYSASWNVAMVVTSYADIGACLVSRLTFRSIDEWILSVWDLLSYVRVLFDILEELKCTMNRSEPVRDIAYNDSATLLKSQIDSFVTLSVKQFGTNHGNLSMPDEFSTVRIDIANHLTCLPRIALASILTVKDETELRDAASIPFYKRLHLDAIWARDLADVASLKHRAIADSDESPECCTFCKAPMTDDHIIMTNDHTARWHLEHFKCDQCHISLKWDLEFTKFAKAGGRVFCRRHAPASAIPGQFAQVGRGKSLSQQLKIAFAKAILAIEADESKRSTKSRQST